MIYLYELSHIDSLPHVFAHRACTRATWRRRWRATSTVCSSPSGRSSRRPNSRNSPTRPTLWRRKVGRVLCGMLNYKSKSDRVIKLNNLYLLACGLVHLDWMPRILRSRSYLYVKSQFCVQHKFVKSLLSFGYISCFNLMCIIRFENHIIY